jgi:hypothetical protein
MGKKITVFLVFIVLWATGQALAQDMDPSSSPVYWKAEGKWSLDEASRRFPPRPFVITLFTFKDGSGYWAEYRPDNASPNWTYTNPVREKVELKEEKNARFFSMSGGYKYYLDKLEAVYETRPTATAVLKKTEP